MLNHPPSPKRRKRIVRRNERRVIAKTVESSTKGALLAREGIKRRGKSFELTEQSVRSPNRVRGWFRMWSIEASGGVKLTGKRVKQAEAPHGACRPAVLFCLRCFCSEWRVTTIRYPCYSSRESFIPLLRKLSSVHRLRQLPLLFPRFFRVSRQILIKSTYSRPVFPFTSVFFTNPDSRLGGPLWRCDT